MDLKELSETLEDAEDYITRLKKLNQQLENAEMQIINTAKETENNINKTFDKLLQTLISELNKRKEQLINETKQIEKQGIEPLKDCRLIIVENLQKTIKFINFGSNILKNDNTQNIEEFNNQASLLGNLPEVPDLKEVPCVSFHLEETVENDLHELCKNLGMVSKIAPVQIYSMSEKPGAILVEWKCLENNDRILDIQEFKLQRAFGNLIRDQKLLVNFKDCYIGSDSQYLVKDVQPNQIYSFRVCCKFEGQSSWSPWSLPQISSTNIKPFCWKPNKDFLLTNDNKIAKPINDNPTILISDGPQFSVGYSVEFTFLECDDIKDCYIGLILHQNFDNVHQILKDSKSESFLINSNGYIYINDSKKSTKLPKITKGSKVCFMCEALNENKIRITVDLQDKRVTYDWIVTSTNQLYLIASFCSSKWKIMIE